MDKATFFSPTKGSVLRATSSKKPKETKFVVNSRTSMQLLSKKRILSTAELETIPKSRNPQRWLQLMGKSKQVRNHMYTFTTLSSPWRCKSSMTRLQSCHQASSAKNTVLPTRGPVVKKPHLTKNGIRILWNTEYVVPIVVPGLSPSSSALPHRYRRTRRGTRGSSKITKWRYPRSSTGKTEAIRKSKLVQKRRTVKQRAVACEISQSGWRSSQIISKMQKYQHPHRLLDVQIRNILQSGNQEASYLYSLLQRPELQNTQANKGYEVSLQEDALEKQYLKEKKSVTWQQQITEFSMKMVSLETITEMQSWCKSLPLNGHNFVRVKRKLFRRRKKFTKVARKIGKSENNYYRQCTGIWQLLWRLVLDSLYVNTPSSRDEWYCWESGTQNKRRDVRSIVAIRLGNMVGWFCWMLLPSSKCPWPLGRWTSTPHRSEAHGIAERSVSRVKEGTSAVLLQSGLDEKWWADSMECFCCLRNVQDLLAGGRTPYERRFGEPCKGPIILFGATIEHFRFLHVTSQGSTNLARKFCQEYSSVFHWSRLEFGKEILLLKILKSRDIWTGQKSMLEGSMHRKYLRQRMVNKDWKVKLSGRDHGIPAREHPVRSKDFRKKKTFRKFWKISSDRLSKRWRRSS